MQQSNRSIGAIQMVPALLAAPILLQPILVVGAVLWARYESVLRHPDFAAKNPPTISRAIVDPAIGDPFANLLLISFVLLVCCFWRIGGALYRPTLSPRMKMLWWTFMLSEFTGAVGMVVLSQYTGAHFDSIHLFASYLLFFGDAVGICAWAIFIGIHRGSADAALAGTKGRPPLPYYPKAHPRMAIAILLITLVFAGIYFGWQPLKRVDNYLTRVVFSMVEVTLLIAFETYLASFTVLIYRYESHRMDRRGALALRESMLSSAE